MQEPFPIPGWDAVEVLSNIFRCLAPVDVLISCQTCGLFCVCYKPEIQWVGCTLQNFYYSVTRQSQLQPLPRLKKPRYCLGPFVYCHWICTYWDIQSDLLVQTLNNLKLQVCWAYHNSTFVVVGLVQHVVPNIEVRVIFTLMARRIFSTAWFAVCSVVSA
jgi:hypothetical protein